tara:strand:+ start:390 stop:572 length:183 start_codon:yes stop_codon:yes gene_type:complete
MSDKEKTLDFKKEKETKNTIRYQEVKDEGELVIGPLYIQKSFLPEKIPENIKITIHINSS